MIGTVIVSIVGIALSNSWLTSGIVIPTRSMAITPPASPAKIISTFRNKSTSIRINGTRANNALNPDGASMVSIPCAKTLISEAINVMKNAIGHTNCLIFFNINNSPHF